MSDPKRLLESWLQRCIDEVGVGELKKAEVPHISPRISREGCNEALEFVLAGFRKKN